VTCAEKDFLVYWRQLPVGNQVIQHMDASIIMAEAVSNRDSYLEWVKSSIRGGTYSPTAVIFIPVFALVMSYPIFMTGRTLYRGFAPKGLQTTHEFR
jgi:hypothetical protein